MFKTPATASPFELTFYGLLRTPRYKRHHGTLPEAQTEARRVLRRIADRNAHPALIYGPGSGNDGFVVH